MTQLTYVGDYNRDTLTLTYHTLSILRLRAMQLWRTVTGDEKSHPLNVAPRYKFAEAGGAGSTQQSAKRDRTAWIKVFKIIFFTDPLLGGILVVRLLLPTFFPSFSITSPTVTISLRSDSLGSTSERAVPARSWIRRTVGRGSGYHPYPSTVLKLDVLVVLSCAIRQASVE
ncbi:hypothetical protein ACLOJK_013997 [Asimina triloba]